MRIYTVVSRIGLAALLVYAAAAEVCSIKPSAGKIEPPPKFPLIFKTVVWTVVACVLLGAAGALLLMASGVYNLAADRPHIAIIDWMLKTGRTRSVEFHSRGIPVPNLTAALAGSGLALFRKNCQPCHGAPGTPNEQIGRGINPTPPRLETSAAKWSDAQLYWIVSRGLKMSGMPGFAPRLSDRDRWAIVAFVRQLAVLSPQDYQSLAAASDAGVPLARWPPAAGLGWIAKADSARAGGFSGITAVSGATPSPE